MEYVIPTKSEHIHYVADRMRMEDEVEVRVYGLSPYSGLLRSVEQSSRCMTLVSKDGEPAAILGVCRTANPQFDMVWLLGTDLIDQYPMTFLKHSKEVLQSLYRPGCDCLWNYVHKDNLMHRKWLKWLGFVTLREVQINDHTFLEFVRLKD